MAKSNFIPINFTLISAKEKKKNKLPDFYVYRTYDYRYFYDIYTHTYVYTDYQIKLK